MNFIQFLTEGSKKTEANLHMEHLEENIFNRGVVGARESIDFLRELRNMLSGKSSSKVYTTTKWDGAPAVICGTNPENGKFFVATKSFFNVEPKINYTEEDIDKNHPGDQLNAKLKIALAYLPKLNIKGILQGDMIFTKGDIKKEVIGDVTYATFRPNTLTYAVPYDSLLTKRMMQAQLGIVFHTTYTGQSLKKLKVSYNVDIGHLTQTKDVWFRDASFVDASGTVTFTEQETQKLTQILSDAGRVFLSINPKAMNYVSLNETINEQIKTFNNVKVRAGVAIKNTSEHTFELIRSVESKLNKDITDAKKEDTRKKRIVEKTEIMRFYRNNASQLKLMFDLMNLIVEAKIMIIRKLETIKSTVDTFILTPNGYRVTGPEGFVAVDRLSGGALKLVDRLEFSHSNFTVAKNWSK
jgi:hypothetical protein